MLFDWLGTFSWLKDWADLTWFRAIVSLVVSLAVIQVAVFGTTIYLHRAATHGALILRPAVVWVFRFALWLTTGIFDGEWVPVHRKHHAFTDLEGDPHSPKLEGFWNVQFGNVFYYVRGAKLMAQNGELERYSQGLETNDWWSRHVFRRGFTGVAVGTAVLCVALGVGWGLFAAGFHAFMYVFVLSSSINGLCHTVGQRNFNNTATNVRILAPFIGGEPLHNNHHEHPRSPKFSFGRWEIDPAWPVIRLLVFCRLATLDGRTIDQIKARYV